MAVRICAEDELEVDHAVKVVVDGTPIALVKDSGGILYAIGDTCSHAEISLSEGFVEDHHIECWAHGARFDLATGRALALPAFDPVPVYEVLLVDGDVYIDMGIQYEEAG